MQLNTAKSNRKIQTIYHLNTIIMPIISLLMINLSPMSDQPPEFTAALLLVVILFVVLLGSAGTLV
jgi:uncharacterized membrane protein